MHTDARTLDNNTVIEADLCIVGAGAAGISLALEWIDTPYNVVVLEAGGFDFENETQQLNKGDITGRHYFPLSSTRLRYFGGTTGHWMGFCSPFDPIDFKKRDWVPHSGWPISREDLNPFYKRAQPVLELGTHDWDADYWADQSEENVLLPFDPERVWTKVWQFSPPTRFNTKYRDALVNAGNIHLYTHANVCNIETNEGVSHAEGLEIRCLNGHTHQVRAKQTVLACGAIQNTRLLLASNKQAPRGLGNDNDLVGRYFMDHVEIDSAHLALPAAGPMDFYMFSFYETPARGELALSEALQEEHKTLNMTAGLFPASGNVRTKSRFDTFPQTAEATLQWWDGIEQAYKAGNRNLPDVSQHKLYRMATRMETAPNPDSRVMLGENTDALGMPLVDLHWQLSPLDKHTVRAFYEALGKEVGQIGLGRLQILDWVYEDDPAWPSHLGSGWHHMGTTRMHEDANQGVVDANNKVHGIDNLYVAGSCVFTTSSAVNPTLTIVALSLRLSDHLKGVMGS
ncbi:MAG: GMC family oxidoreductase [Bacteroidota bacterium]